MMSESAQGKPKENSRRVRRWPGRLMLVLTGLVIGVAVAEISARILNRRGSIVHEEAIVHDNGEIHPGLTRVDDPVRVFIIKPDQYLSNGDRRETINAFGFRGRIPKRQDPDALCIALVGDSFTYGFEVDDDQTMARHLEAMAAKRAEHPVEVWNFGVGGYNTAQVGRLLEDTVLPLKPDLIVYGYFFNDPELYWQEGNPVLSECAPLLEKHNRLAGFLAKSQFMAWVYESIGSVHMKRFGQDEAYFEMIHSRWWPGYWVMQAALVGMRDAAQSADVPFYLATMPVGVEMGSDVAQTVNALCRGLGVKVINVCTAFDGIDDSTHELWTKVCPHYSDLGNQIVASNLWEHLQANEPELLEKRSDCVNRGRGRGDHQAY